MKSRSKKVKVRITFRKDDYMSLSNDITRMLLEMLEDGGRAEIQRNELAQTLGCVPSQINYVISSRFTPEQGYIVESRRGGGGYIKITRINLESLIMHTVNHIGEAIDYATCHATVMNLLHNGAINTQSAKLLLAATGENSLKGIPVPLKDRIRAAILKQMLITLE